MNKLKTAVRVTEIDGFSDTLVRVFKGDTAAQKDAFLKATMAELENLSAKITTAILQDKSLSTLDKADGERDEALRSLGAVLTGYASLPIAAKKEAAIPLKAVYDKYAKAGIARANYTSESSMIESLLEDFSAPALAANIAALDGVSEAIAAVRAAQDAFTKANDDYVAAKSDKSAPASSFKKPILSLVNEKIVPYLDAMTIAQNSECAAFARATEEEIKRINSVIASRGKKGGEEE